MIFVVMNNRNFKGSNNPNYKHGMRGTRPYSIWQAMKARCDKKTTINYQYYGGKGVSYDPRWGSFIEFWNDMSKGYSDGLTLDRINSDNDYTKDNCRWISIQKQQFNKSTNHKVTFKGKTQSIREWERELGYKQGTLQSRIRAYGWPVEKALTIPSLKGTNYKTIEPFKRNKPKS